MSSTSTTSLSLIERVRLRDAAAWHRFTELYTPLVYGWLRSASLQESDSADLSQEVFRAVARGIEGFGVNGKPTRFRAWLRGITRHKLQDYFRSVASQPQATGGTDANLRLAELAELLPESEEQNEEEASWLARRAMQLIKTDFQESTWLAFWRVTVGSESPADVARDLKMSVAAVYTAKSRVLAHLRRELEGLDEAPKSFL